MSAEKREFRMDFVQRIISFDEKSRTFKAVLDPDPQRYEWKEISGERCLYDKLDKLYIPEQVYAAAIRELSERIREKGVSLELYKIDDVEPYIKTLPPRIAQILDGTGPPLPNFQDKSEAFLDSLINDMLDFVIVSLDVKGSTKLSIGVEPESYARLMGAFLYALSEVIPRFSGHVLKYTGDGLIAYFSEPCFIRKNDFAVNCVYKLHQLTYEVLNPLFEKRGFPVLDIRIGLDAGQAYVMAIGSPQTKRHADIIGKVVNLAAKIQAQAGPGEICLGDTVQRNLHTALRRICEPVRLGKEWDYRNLSGDVYEIHRLRLDKKWPTSPNMVFTFHSHE